MIQRIAKRRRREFSDQAIAMDPFFFPKDDEF